MGTPWDENVTYPQWFALLTMKHFGAWRPDSVLRSNTFQALARRGLASLDDAGTAYVITDKGLRVEEDCLTRKCKSR